MSSISSMFQALENQADDLEPIESLSLPTDQSKSEFYVCGLRPAGCGEYRPVFAMVSTESVRLCDGRCI